MICLNLLDILSFSGISLDISPERKKKVHAAGLMRLAAICGGSVWYITTSAIKKPLATSIQTTLSSLEVRPSIRRLDKNKHPAQNLIDSITQAIWIHLRYFSLDA